jgi:hypothetical protein
VAVYKIIVNSKNANIPQGERERGRERASNYTTHMIYSTDYCVKKNNIVFGIVHCTWCIGGHYIRIAFVSIQS